MAHDALAEPCRPALATLAENEIWKRVTANDQTAILQSVGMVTPAKPNWLDKTQTKLIEAVKRGPVLVK